MTEALAQTAPRPLPATLTDGPGPPDRAIEPLVSPVRLRCLARTHEVPMLGPEGWVSPLEMRCSFCGKHRDEVLRLIAGPGVCICEGCVHRCNTILSADDAITWPWKSMEERVEVPSAEGRWELLFCFGVGFNNFRTGRRSMSEPIASDHLKVVASFGATGNLAVRAESKVQGRVELGRLLGSHWTALSAQELETALSALQSWPPPETEQGVRWTPGLAFRIATGVDLPSYSEDIRSRPGSSDRFDPTELPDLAETRLARLLPIDDDVVALYKRDPLDGRDRLDRNRRQGGWSAVSAEIVRQVGGVWTSRSESTVRGLLNRTAAASG